MIDQLLSVSTRNALSNLSETVNQTSMPGAASPATAATGQPSFDNVLSQLTGKLQNAEAVSLTS
ncbi:hypothetical protein NY486_28110, partial [Enterobacter hormaechei]|nr:hypothetical protein [Enterobacter hormaechei]